MAEQFDFNHPTDVIDAEWDAVYTAGGGTVDANTDAALIGAGVYGLEVSGGSTDTAYVWKLPGGSSNIIRFRFYLDLNDLSVPAAGSLDFCYLGVFFGSVNLKITIDQASPHNIVFHIWDEGSSSYPASITVTGVSSGNHYYEVRMKRAASPVTFNAEMEVWQDGVSQGTITAIDFIDLFDDWGFGDLKMGIVASAPAISGSFYLDGVVLRDDDTEIGAGEALPALVTGGMRSRYSDIGLRGRYSDTGRY